MKSGKGKTILAWAILLSIPITGFFLQRHINTVCADISELLHRAEQEIASPPLEQAIDLWKDHQLVLTALTPHEEVDAVTQSLRRSLAFIYADNTEEFYASIAEALAELEVVRTFDRPSIRTIF